MRSLVIKVHIGRYSWWPGWWHFSRANSMVAETSLRVWRLTVALTPTVSWYVEFRVHR